MKAVERAVAIIEVDESKHCKYRQLRMDARDARKFRAPESLIRELFDLHLELFYPAILDKTKPTMPPAIFYMNIDEELAEAEQKGKNGMIRVLHPMLQ